jgi:hypothetical protein
MSPSRRASSRVCPSSSSKDRDYPATEGGEGSEGRVLQDATLLLALIHRSAWKGYSPKFAGLRPFLSLRGQTSPKHHRNEGVHMPFGRRTYLGFRVK